MAGFDFEFPSVPGAFEDFAFAGEGHAGEAAGGISPAVAITWAGLPWFDYYGGDLKALEGAEKLAGLDSVAVKKLKKGECVLADNEAVVPKVVKRLGRGKVREGEFW